MDLIYEGKIYKDLIYEKWCYVAELCEEEYGVQYDREEDFFICPECGESLYFIDWKNDIDFSEDIFCPICDFYFEVWDSIQDKKQKLFNDFFYKY